MSARVGWMVWLVVVAMGLAGPVQGAENKDANKPGMIEGVISANDLGLAGQGEVCRITVKAAKDAGRMRITPQTRILRIDGQNKVMALPADLTPGSTVRARYEQPVLQSKPWQSTALEVLILRQAK